MQLRFHHIAIATHDLDAAVKWYESYFGAQCRWALSEFAPLTAERAPGITRMVELSLGGVFLHVYETPHADGSKPPWFAGEHFCLQAHSLDELLRLRQRWFDLRDAGELARVDPPTEVITDKDGIASFYGRDVTGLEYEVTYIPAGESR